MGFLNVGYITVHDVRPISQPHNPVSEFSIASNLGLDEKCKITFFPHNERFLLTNRL